MAFNDKQRPVTDEDLGLFDIFFEAILDHPPTFDCFTKFLYSSFNSESSEFLEKVNEYRKIKHERKRLQMATQMYEKYIAEGANTQLNLRSDLKQKISKVIFSQPPPTASSPSILTDTSRVSVTIPSSASRSSDCVKTPSSPPTAIRDLQRNSNYRNSCDSESSTESSLTEPNTPLSETDSSCGCPKTLFDEVESMVLLSLKESHFKSFLESDTFKQYAKKQPLKTLYEIGAVKANTTLFFVESLGDLKSERFSVNDFQFLKDQMLNTDKKEWELIGSSDAHKTFLSNKTFDFGGSLGLQFFKFEVTFPFGVKECMNTLMEQEYRLKYDGELAVINQLNYAHMKPSTNTAHPTMASSITQEIYKLGWPLDNREFIVSSSGIYDSAAGMYIIGKKTCQSDKAPPVRKGTLRVTCLGGWGFQPIDEHTTKYYQVFYIDFKGNVPRAFIRALLKGRAKRFLKTGSKYMKMNEKRGFICKEDNLMWKTIQENGTIQLK